MIKLTLKTVKEVTANGVKLCTNVHNNIETSKYMYGNRYYITMRNISKKNDNINIFEVDANFIIDIQ